MCSTSDPSGGNTGGPEPEPDVPVDGVTVETEPDTSTGGPSRGRHDLTPYLALIITAYDATRSLPVTAVIAVIAAITNRRR